MVQQPTPAQFAAQLMARREVLIRTIVADNYEAVRDAFATFNNDKWGRMPGNAQNLADTLVLLDNEPEDRALVDQCINVPWKGTAGSPVVREAYALILDRAQRVGGEAMQARGLAALVAIARQDKGTADSADSEAATVDANARGMAETEARKRELKRLGKWAAISAGVLIIIIIYIITRKA